MATNYLYDEQIIVGKTVQSVVKNNNEELLFEFTDGSSCKFYHEQDCCENVEIDYIEDLSVLKGLTLTAVNREEIYNSNSEFDSSTITNFWFLSEKEKIQVTWLGTSNGYYSESVHFDYYP
jgi:hypothetical protein